MLGDDIDFDAVEKLMKDADLQNSKNEKNEELYNLNYSTSTSCQSSAQNSVNEESVKEETFEIESRRKKKKEKSRERSIGGSHRHRYYRGESRYTVKESNSYEKHSKGKEKKGNRKAEENLYYKEHKKFHRDASREVRHLSCETNLGKTSIRKKSRSRSRSRSITKNKNRYKYTSKCYNEKKTYNDENHKEKDRFLKEEEALKKEEQRKQKEIEEARRDDLTVLVINLSLKCSEKDIYEFFSEHAGKVRDVQCIRDQRSGKFKGVAYVEFYTYASVAKAINLTGETICGQCIKIQASQAEKNRAAKAMKLYNNNDITDGAMKIYVGGLVEDLSNISENDLKLLFSPFGEILNIDIHKDAYTGNSKGYGFVLYKKACDARDAIYTMDGFKIAGKSIKVCLVNENQNILNSLQKENIHHSVGNANINDTDFVCGNNSFTKNSNAYSSTNALINNNQIHFYNDRIIQKIKGENDFDMEDNERLDDDESGGLLSDANSKFALMQKLRREDKNEKEIDSFFGGVTNAILSKVKNNKNAAGVVAQAKALANTVLGNNIKMNKTISSYNTNHNLFSSQKNKVTTNVVLSNMFEKSDVDLQEEPEFLNEICEDVKEECARYGTVIKIWIDPVKLDGRVWIKFLSTDESLKAINGLNGRYFAGKAVTAEFVEENIF